MGASEPQPVRRVGTLGSLLTFAGQATQALLERRPDLGGPEYFPTMDDVAAAVLDGRIEVGVLTSETSHTACTETAARLLAGERLFIAEEIVVPYHCALLGKPGSRLADITHVGGHGSIRQCRRFLAERLPHATVEIHRQNSVEAAREVLDGDGSTAVIGTEAAAAALGLDIIERDVDGGSAGGWWALAATLAAPQGADHLAVRVDGSAALNEALAHVARLGLVVRTITNAPTGEIFRYRYLLVLRTPAGEPLGDQAIDAFGPQVVGIYRSWR
ncbi:prephenate dehydratase domain-containing protein [Phytohabitans rumicis]|uniref:prephenate dehydratase n=1 Tax=Phytohabitans rumicis TaxID=1076125 RepID=A0A6V8LGX2_9ACTN|nr:prephenate dehydratase domain-containing protein [Phytohabitans rumicis]GFJ96503.1 prephenate dehydratase [Phytohabitans rumicis]